MTTVFVFRSPRGLLVFDAGAVGSRPPGCELIGTASLFLSQPEDKK